MVIIFFDKMEKRVQTQIPGEKAKRPEIMA
jgi:hypothetical protein